MKIFSVIVMFAAFALLINGLFYYTRHDSGISKSSADKMCVVGGHYTICGPKQDNPFEKRGVATVIITDKQNGFVKYCWDHDYGKPDPCYFTRSCQEFVWMINECKSN